MAQNEAILAFVSGNEDILKEVGFLRLSGGFGEINELKKSARTEGFEGTGPHALGSTFKQNIRDNLSEEDAESISKMVDAMVEKGIRDDYIVLVGGAPLNEAFAESVGADAYCRDAAVAVETAKEMIEARRDREKAAG